MMGSEQRRCIGAILVGGRSSRMGQPKHLLTLPDGRTFLHAIIDVLQPMTERIAIVGRVALPADIAAHAGIEMLDDLRANRGPLGGIESLLASGMGEMYLPCGCDMPMLTNAALEPLIARATQPDQPVMVVYQSGARVEPLPCLIRAMALSTVGTLLDEQRASMNALVAAVTAATIPLMPGEQRRLASINTPEQFTLMLEALRDS